MFVTHPVRFWWWLAAAVNSAVVLIAALVIVSFQGKSSVIMSVSVHENRKSRTSTGSMNILLFHKASHPDCVLSHLNTLRKHCMFTDVTLWAGNRSFPCHRAVLAASSRYFEAMFSNGLRESLDDEVNFHDSLHPEVLELLLDFAYSSRIIINEENAESLLEAGDMLQFHDVRDAAAEFLEKNLYPSNCLGMMLLSDAHQCRRLYELSWRMCLVNFETVHKSEDFNNLSKDTLLDLISSDELEIEDEEKVFKAVIQWVKYDLDERKAYLPELLRNVRLALLPSECLKEALACEDLIMVDERNKLVLDEAIQCKKKILQHDGVVTSPCARPRKAAGHTLLILGGQTFMCDKIYQVDHKAKEIIPKADLPSPRKEFSACAIGCKVYITGGRGSENGVSKDVWVYDTVHEEWSKAAPMLIARFGHGSAELENCLYVVGGHTAVAGVFPASPSVSLKQVEKYDPVSNKWMMVAPLRDGVSNAAVLLSAPGSTCHHDEGQGLGACIQEVNKVPESHPCPLSRCWSQHSDRVPSRPPAQDSEEPFASPPEEPFASLPSTSSRRHSWPRCWHHATGARRATQPHHRPPRRDGEEPGALAAGLRLGTGARGRLVGAGGPTGLGRWRVCTPRQARH
ncbi:kelch-like protein 25 isoform X2 [Ciconia boyciana]|uniref:kelch-like protein 25 isoform X2 n=1 Tax=Ciconia boyciana TaxID=52775 RepID=UPI003B9F84BB